VAEVRTFALVAFIVVATAAVGSALLADHVWEWRRARCSDKYEVSARATRWSRGAVAVDLLVHHDNTGAAIDEELLPQPRAAKGTE